MEHSGPHLDLCPKFLVLSGSRYLQQLMAHLTYFLDLLDG
jgi:hypothetical protein